MAAGAGECSWPTKPCPADYIHTPPSQSTRGGCRSMRFSHKCPGLVRTLGLCNCCRPGYRMAFALSSFGVYDPDIYPTRAGAFHYSEHCGIWISRNWRILYSLRSAMCMKMHSSGIRVRDDVCYSFLCVLKKKYV
jgi:hypothetical protein